MWIGICLDSRPPLGEVILHCFSNNFENYSIIIVSREKNCIILLRITKRIWENKVASFDTFVPETDEKRVISGGLGVKNRGDGGRMAEKKFLEIFCRILAAKKPYISRV